MSAALSVPEADDGFRCRCCGKSVAHGVDGLFVTVSFWARRAGAREVMTESAFACENQECVATIFEALSCAVAVARDGAT